MLLLLPNQQGVSKWTSTARRSRKLSSRRMRLARRHGGFFQLAKKLASCSTYGNFRHGAVLAKGGAILNIGINSEKYSSIGAKHRPDHKGHSTYHAEISALMGLDRSQTKGAVMYVARASKGKYEDRMSKPCAMCHAVMEERGISRVYYSVDGEHIGTYKVKRSSDE